MVATGGKMASFISTYVNKVDKKGRVSVPAAFRAALSGQAFQGLIAFPSITEPAVEAFGRDMLDELDRQRLQQRMAGGDFERALLGAGDDDLIETILASASELPFDGEGRIVLPQSLAAHAGIDGMAAFVGRGSRIQIWSPDRFEKRQADTLSRLRARLANGGGA